MKKVTVVLLLAMMTPFLFFSCSEKNKNAELEAGSKKQIYFWHALGDARRSGWINARAKEFNKTQSKYEIVPQAKGSYRETLQAAIMASTQSVAPHLVHVFEAGSQLAFDANIFEPIQNLGNFDSADYIEPVLNYYTINGKINSIPFNSSSPILYYNKDLMKKAGLDPNKPPRTFEEVIAFSEKAKQAGIDAAGLGFCLHSWYYEQWLAEQNANLVNNGNGRSKRADEVLLDSEASYRIFNWIKELNDKGFYKYTGKKEDWGGSDSIFIQGKVMFHITSTADLGNIYEATKDSFALGTGYLPIPSEVKRNGTVIGGGSIWFAEDHPREEQLVARDFVLYMTNTENMVDWHKLTGYYPVRKSSIEELKKEGWFKKAGFRITAFNQLLETKVNTASGGALLGSLLDTRTIVEEAIQKVLNGGDVDASLKEAKKLSDLKLKEYNKNF